MASKKKKTARPFVANDPRRLQRPPAPAEVERTAEQVEDEQVGFIVRLRLWCLTEREIAAACRERFGIGTTRVERLLRIALEELRQKAELNRPYTKAEASWRLRADLRTISNLIADELARVETPKRRGPDPKVVATLVATKATVESRLADVEGTRAPEQHVVHANLTTAAQVVFANLTPERTQELLDRAIERRRLAESVAATDPT